MSVREERLEGLAIRWIDAEVQTLQLVPGATLVLMHPHVLSVTAMERLRAHMQELFPGHRCIILEEGMRVGVVIPAGDDAP